VIREFPRAQDRRRSRALARLVYTGDGGAATGAELSAPVSVFVDPAGDVFIADRGNNVIP